MAAAPPPAPDALPNFLPEDYLTLLRAGVALAWLGVAAMLAVRAGFAMAGFPWPTLGGFDQTYLALLIEFAVTAAALSVLAVRRDWFERSPRAAPSRLRALLTLVIVWLSFHQFVLFHMLGGLHGPLLPALPLLLCAAFLCLPRSAAWATAALLLGGHVGVVLMEYVHWIPSPGALAYPFNLDGAFGTLALLAVFAAALGLGLLARQQFDRAGANLHRGTRINAPTGLYEQGFLLERLGTELRRVGRQGGNVALMLIEFDGFSAYTGAHGFDAGRQALRHAAAALIRTTRHDMDTPARYGATTFAVLLPDARREHAGEFAERVRAALAAVSGGALQPRAALATVTTAGVQPEAVIRGATDALRQSAPGIPVRVAEVGIGPGT